MNRSWESNGKGGVRPIEQFDRRHRLVALPIQNLPTTGSAGQPANSLAKHQLCQFVAPFAPSEFVRLLDYSSMKFPHGDREFVVLSFSKCQHIGNVKIGEGNSPEFPTFYFFKCSSPWKHGAAKISSDHLFKGNQCSVTNI